MTVFTRSGPSLLFSAMVASAAKVFVSSLVVLAADDVKPVAAAEITQTRSIDDICPVERNLITASRCRKGLMLTCEGDNPRIVCDPDGYPVHVAPPPPPPVNIYYHVYHREDVHVEQHVTVHSHAVHHARSQPRNFGSLLQSLFHPRGR